MRVRGIVKLLTGHSPVVNRTARIRAIGHGGQMLASTAFKAAIVDPDTIELLDLGIHWLKDLSKPEHVYQVCAEGASEILPPLKSLPSRLHNLPIQQNDSRVPVPSTPRTSPPLHSYAYLATGAN